MKKSLLFLMVLVCGVIFNGGVTEAQQVNGNYQISASEKLIRYIPEGVNSGWIITEKIDNATITPFANENVKSCSKTVYMQYSCMGEVVVRVSHSVTFNYGYSDGTARVTTNTYAVLRCVSGYSIKNISASKASGNPARATVSFVVYEGSTKKSTMYNTIYCTKSGSVSF